MTLRILIADDEPLARARLRALVGELGHRVCAEVGDGMAAEQALREQSPDVALLDIAMPVPDGLTLARRIERDYPQTAVVLVTAHAEHAVAAFDADVRDYLLKPVRRERLARALERVAGTKARASVQGSPILRLTIGRKERLVHLNEIDCFVAEQGYVIARSATLEGFTDLRLHELEARFGPALLRVHRSCLAVSSSVAGIETHSATDHRLLFRDGMAPVPISRRQLAEVRASLQGAGGTTNFKST
jgi:two-component system, LytTR family, response regulator AlgR